MKENNKFQSPSLRGSGRFILRTMTKKEGQDRVSIPFIAGQWSLPTSCKTTPTSTACFNPLHCGAVVASRRRRRRHARGGGVSIPFIAGQWSLRSGAGSTSSITHWVSIPFIAGQWSLR